MKTIFYKYFLFITGTLVAGIAMAQSANNSVVAFKEIQRKHATDNFTAREIKKKEFQIAPSNIILLNRTVNQHNKEEKFRKKKKIVR